MPAAGQSSEETSACLAIRTFLYMNGKRGSTGVDRSKSSYRSSSIMGQYTGPWVS